MKETKMECRHQLGEANKGWYTCALCGKKFRGAEAKEILAAAEGIESVTEALTPPTGVVGPIEAPGTTEGKGNVTGNTGKAVSFTDKQGREVTIYTSSPVYPPLVSPIHKATSPVGLSSGKMVTGKTVTIECIDCGAERVIKVQDAFQVVRCTECQKKYRNMKRRLARKNNNEEG